MKRSVLSALIVWIVFAEVAEAEPLQGVAGSVFLHTAADVQPEDLEKPRWDDLMAKVKARLEEGGLNVQTGDWFSAQQVYEESRQQGKQADPPGARVMVSLALLKDQQGRYVYSTRFELRELGYFVRPAGSGYRAQGQQLHADLAFFQPGEQAAPPNRIAEWKAVQSGDVASYATPGTLGFSAWAGVEQAVLGEADRFAREWKKAQRPLQ